MKGIVADLNDQRLPGPKGVVRPKIDVHSLAVSRERGCSRLAPDAEPHFVGRKGGRDVKGKRTQLEGAPLDVDPFRLSLCGSSLFKRTPTLRRRERGFEILGRQAR